MTNLSEKYVEQGIAYDLHICRYIATFVGKFYISNMF